MGLAPKQRDQLTTAITHAFAALVPVPLSGGPTELSMAREPGDRHRALPFYCDSGRVSARSQSPFPASVFNLS